MSAQPRRAIVIGATSTIASAVCRRLASSGTQLFLLGRNAERLRQLAEELGDAVQGQRAGDFREMDQNAARIAEARQALGQIDLALIAHGDLGDQLETERSFTAANAVLEANLGSVVSFLIPLANHMETERSGTLAVITSVAGERGRPRNYTYGAAKAALNVYLQGLRSRLYPVGVRVVTLKLGPVDTPMTATHDKNALFVSADAAADGILSAVRASGPEEVYVPGYWRPIMAVVRGLPEAVFQRVPFLVGR